VAVPCAKRPRACILSIRNPALVPSPRSEDSVPPEPTPLSPSIWRLWAFCAFLEQVSQNQHLRNLAT